MLCIALDLPLSGLQIGDSRRPSGVSGAPSPWRFSQSFNNKWLAAKGPSLSGMVREKRGMKTSRAVTSAAKRAARRNSIRNQGSLPEDLPEPQISDNARKVLQNRYLAKDKVSGEVCESPKELFWRVAVAVAQPEFEEDPQQGLKWARRFYELMATGTFMPNSPTLMNAGREMGMLSACFVLPVEDSIEGIFATLKHVALIQKAGGGTGFSFSRLRPDGDIVSTSGGTTSGPLSFIDAYSAGTDAIQQGAFRRGANMGVLRCDHPDVVEFIRAKDDLSRWTNYNVSVAVTQAWMEAAVEQPHAAVVITNPRDGRQGWLRRANGRRISEADYESFGEDKTADPESFWTYGEVLDRIVHFAWKNGEPGLLFLDRANADNMLPQLGAYEATNPCGEQWLLPYSSCNLGSINLGKFVKADVAEALSWEDHLDWEALDQVIADSTRFLDDVVTINRFPIDEIRDRADEERRIGLGVMGFADLLYRLGISYGSAESFEAGRVLARRLRDTATSASEKLVSESGRAPYLAWEGSQPEQDGMAPRRNSHLTTVAPTGTISIIAGCSGGIEPLFSLAFQRQVMKDADGQPVVMKEVHPHFRTVLVEHGYSAAEIEQVVDQALEQGSVGDSDLPQEVRRVFVTARDIPPDQHILMQAAWQTSIDNAVSKTINLPTEASEEDVRTAFLMAWRERCKGVTVYRDGCRDMQPMALKEKAKKESKAPIRKDDGFPVAHPMKLPEIMPCVRVRQMTPFGNMHVKISVDPQAEREMEVFAQLGKGGDVANSDLEAICRMISLFLRCGGAFELALKQLEGIGSSLTLPSKEGRIMSLADGLAKALHKYLYAKSKHGVQAILLGKFDPDDLHKNGNGHRPKPLGLSGNRLGSGAGGAFKVKCPACSGNLVHEEGCSKCYDCGFSQC
ncbi:MAG: adenosylcobalamin-dependent ribonucleoside-diphosphate reductase [Planctomycetota bacterium]|nr:MAG: adenosylcobalamin-dependent ribonucleoside-diphosphate reductase [Planctomycetota bacterium]